MPNGKSRLTSPRQAGYYWFFVALFLRVFLLVLLIDAGMATNALAQDEQEPAPSEPSAGSDDPQGADEPGDRQGPDQPGNPEQEVAAEQPPEEAPATGETAVERRGYAEPADDIIVDPELEGVAPAYGTGQQPSTAAGQQDSTGIVRMVLRSRFGADLQWEDPREEVWEATQLMLLEATVRRSENLRFMVGIRARHQFSAMREDTVETRSERVQLDATPTAGYADATLTDGLHLRAGYQIVKLGRFDVFSASNFLDGLDLRNGPATMPEAAEFAQPALRLDWDALQWLSLKAIYLPFFIPHIVELSDSDYALMPLDQATMDAMVSGFVGHQGEFPESDYMRKLMKQYQPRSARSRMSESGFSAFAPDPDLTDPQGALRITAHGRAGEVALTAGTALERLPAVAMTQEEWMFMEQNRFLRGAALHLAWSPSDSGWTFEVAGALITGPTYLVAPRIEAHLVAELYAEVGAFFWAALPPLPPSAVRT